MVRKIFSVLVTFLIMAVLALLSTTLILRSTLTVDNILKIMNSVSSSTVPTFDQAIDNAFEQSGLDGEVSDYVDKKELEGAVQNYLNDFMSYQLSDGEMPKLNSDEIKGILDKAITQYENKTGKTVDRSEIDKSLEDADKELAKSEKISTQMDTTSLNAAKMIYSLITSKLLVIGLSGGLVLLIGILFLLNMNVSGTLAYLISAFMINGVSIIAIPIILNVIFSGMKVITIISKPFYTYGIISIAIAVVFIIINIILKIVKKKKEPEQQIEIPAQY